MHTPLLGSHFVRTLRTLAILGCLGIGDALAQSPPDYSPRAFQHAGDSLTIQWDTRGVPEIDSSGAMGAMFGWGYAESVDRFFQMEMARREMQGRQAELLGGAAIGSKKSPSTSDRDVRRLRIPYFLGLAHDRFEQDHPQKYALLESYSAGVNRYLEEKLGPANSWTSNPNFTQDLESVHPLFADFPLVASRFWPWTPLDCMAALDFTSNPRDPNVMSAAGITYAYRYLTLPAPGNQVYQPYYRGTYVGPPLSHKQALSELLGPMVFDEEAVAVKELDVPGDLHDDIFEYARKHGWAGRARPEVGMGAPPGVAAPTFSHGTAVGGARVEGNDGRAVVLAMPQLNVTKMLFECSVRAAGSYSSRGVSFVGCPGFLVGFNEALSWGVTSAGGTPVLTYELRRGRDQEGELDPDLYLFNEQVLSVRNTPDCFPVRDAAGQASWTDECLTVRWAPELQHSPTHPEQTVFEGLPIVTDQMSALAPDGTTLLPLEDFQYAVVHPRYFDNTRSTLLTYLDMLEAADVGELDAAVQNYTNPAVGMYAGDSNGDVGFWYLKELPLHSPKRNLSPLGSIGVNGLARSNHLIADIIPIGLLPHVINPTHQLQPGQRSPMENIVVSGNSGAVGAWYPLPVYGGYGDSLRSLRFWQLLRAYPSNGQGAGSPDDRFSPETIMGLQYDDVAPNYYTFARAAMHQAMTQGEVFGQDATDMLNVLAAGSWLSGGGHAHSVLPEMGGVGLMTAPFRTEPSVRALTEVFGQAEAGRCQLVRAFERLFAAGFTGDMLDVISAGRSEVRAAAKSFLDQHLGNGYSLAVRGTKSGSSMLTHEPLGLPAVWRPQYHSRLFNVQINDLKTTGAAFRIAYHGDLLGYGSLDPAHDVDSNNLANPRFSLGNMTSSFYTQWTHFGWLNDSNDHAQATFGPGNSLHPASPFFYSDEWERDGLLFDLDAALANPRLYVRDAPLQ